MPANMYRSVRGQVYVRGTAVIEDRGYLRLGPPASDYYYWFSEVGAGVQSLVLVGKKPEIVNFLINRADKGIRNTIAELPEIYMAIGRYVPGERYRGLFPLQDALQALTEGICALSPGSVLTDLVGAFKDIRDSVENINGGLMKKVYSSQSKKEHKWTGDWYIKFHYLQDRDKRMTLVAKRKLKFKQVLDILSLEWGG